MLLSGTGDISANLRAPLPPGSSRAAHRCWVDGQCSLLKMGGWPRRSTLRKRDMQRVGDVGRAGALGLGGKGPASQAYIPACCRPASLAGAPSSHQVTLPLDFRHNKMVRSYRSTDSAGSRLPKSPSSFQRTEGGTEALRETCQGHRAPGLLTVFASPP